MKNLFFLKQPNRNPKNLRRGKVSNKLTRGFCFALEILSIIKQFLRLFRRTKVGKSKEEKFINFCWFVAFL
jgi:hypothetical protein